MDRNSDTIFKIENLFVKIPTRQGTVHAVNGITLSIEKGQTLGLVGESGCGKTVSCLTALGLQKKHFRVKGKTCLNHREIHMLTPSEKRRVLGKQVGFIMQNPMQAFNPLITIEEHFRETIRSHKKASLSEVRKSANDLLQKVGLAGYEKILHQYPIQLSGGMLQRVMIALALILKPRLLIADEPTTALDTTLQSQIVKLFKKLKKNSDISILLISHDVDMIASIADKISVMYAGYIVEQGPTEEVISRPLHPYTKGLLLSRPRFSKERLHTIPGHPPSLLNLADGCPFYQRCFSSGPLCPSFSMDLQHCGNGHFVSCAYIDKSFDKHKVQEHGSPRDTVNF